MKDLLAVAAALAGGYYLWSTGKFGNNPSVPVAAGSQAAFTGSTGLSSNVQPKSMPATLPNPNAPQIVIDTFPSAPGPDISDGIFTTGAPTSNVATGVGYGPQPDPSVNYSQLRAYPLGSNQGLVQRPSPYGNLAWVVPNGNTLDWLPMSMAGGPVLPGGVWVNGGPYQPPSQTYGYSDDKIVYWHGDTIQTANGDFPPLSPTGHLAFRVSPTTYSYIRGLNTDGSIAPAPNTGIVPFG